MSEPVPQWFRSATRIINTPRNRREHAFEAARRSLADALRDGGFDPASPPASTWLDAYMEGLRLLVSNIEASGGGVSGPT